MRLGRLRLRSQMLLGFGLLVVLMLAVASFGGRGLYVVSDQVGRMNIVSENVRRSQNIIFRMETMRRALTRYRFDHDAGSLKDAVQADASVAALLSEAAQAAMSAERRASIEAAASDLRAIATKRDQFVALVKSAEAERTALDDAGTSLQDHIVRWVSTLMAGTEPDALAAGSDAQIALMAMRIANLKFQIDPGPDLVDTFRAASVAARHALVAFDAVAAPGAKPEIEATVHILDDYAARFDKDAAVKLLANTLFDNEIRQDIEALQGKLLKRQEILASDLDAASRVAVDTASASWHEQLGLTVAGCAAGILLALLFARLIGRPITVMTAAMTRLAGGDTKFEVPARDGANEIAAMARAVEIFRQHAIENGHWMAERDKRQAANELRQAAMDRHTEDFGMSVAGVLASFSVSAETLRQAADDVAEGVKLTRDTTSSSVEGAVVSSRNLNAVAATAEELAVSINGISQQVAQVTASVRKAIQRAAESDAKVSTLLQATDRIGDVVRLINGIAGQTNLLALNATIEAARSGEAGKGFAVVAGEVKALAAQTARATEQIGSQIVAIRDATGHAAAAARDVSTAIGQVETVATAIAAAVEEQAAATRQITNSVHSVSGATEAAADAIAGVLAVAERTSESSQRAHVASADVGRTSDTLRDEVIDFLTAMAGLSETERRLYERISGNQFRATLTLAGSKPIEAEITDISRGGLAVRFPREVIPGTLVTIGLPGGGLVGGRAVRSADGVMVLVFRQDDASLRQIDACLAIIGGGAERQAA